MLFRTTLGPLRILALGLFLATAASGAGCKKRAPETISDPVAGATIVLPSGFKSGPIPGASTEAQAAFRLQASNVFKDIGVGVISESKSDMVESYTLDSYTRLVTKKREAALQDFRLESEVPNKVCDGSPCLEQRFSAKATTVRIAYIVTIIETAKAFHQVITWTSPSRVATNQADMKSIHDSFREAK